MAYAEISCCIEQEHIWGAARIAEAINKTPAATFHLLERNRLPGAKRIGTRWVLHLPTWRASFQDAAA
jgi:hypothetical protein